MPSESRLLDNVLWLTSSAKDDVSYGTKVKQVLLITNYLTKKLKINSLTVLTKQIALPLRILEYIEI